MKSLGVWITGKKRAVGGCHDVRVMLGIFEDVHRRDLACFGSARGKSPTAQEVRHSLSSEYLHMYKTKISVSRAVRKHLITHIRLNEQTLPFRYRQRRSRIPDSANLFIAPSYSRISLALRPGPKQSSLYSKARLLRETCSRSDTLQV